MTLFLDKGKAVVLRKQGMSYSQIKKQIKVSKGTLSYWLKEYPLSKKRISELRDKNESRIEKFRETMKIKKDKRLEEVYQNQKEIILPLTKKELLIAGLFLYWGEGSKFKIGTLSIANTDPSVIIFFIFWLKECFEVPKDKIKIDLQLYKDMDIKEEIRYWSTIINIPIQQFTKPYIKKTSSLDIKHKGSFGHGTCNARIGDIKIVEKVLMSIEVIKKSIV